MSQPERDSIVEIEAGAEALARLVSGQAKRQLETVVLPSWLTARRWYAAKDAGRPEVRITQASSFDGDAGAVLAELTATPPGQASQKYLLPLALGRGDAEGSPSIADVRIGGERARLVEALDEDGFVRALARRMAGGDGTPDPQTRLVFRGAAAEQPTDAVEGQIERSGAEQSNTSLRIGRAMLKAFRKLESGVHPELEMTRHLTERTAFANAPALLGSLERLDDSGEPTALCVLQALVPNEGDGWGWTLDRLARAEPDGDGLRHLAERLGARTAELHQALAAPSDEPAFTPEPITKAQLRSFSDGARKQAALALEALRQVGPTLATPLRDAAERLLGRTDALDERIKAWTPALIEAVRTRLHGDYHLGQVLVTAEDIFIIDFEGEPMRPMAERRAKHSPLKDVAGMLRSFAYAGAAAAKAAEGKDAATRMRVVASEMADVFLARYREAIGGCPSWPADPEDANGLLRLFLLEKALYEVRYEAANRPEWLSTPIEGVIALLDVPSVSRSGPSLFSESRSVRP